MATDTKCMYCGHRDEPTDRVVWFTGPVDLEVCLCASHDNCYERITSRILDAIAKQLKELADEAYNQ